MGCFVGEISSFLNETLLTTNLKTIEETEVFVIDKEDFSNFLRNNPGIMMFLNKIKFIH